MPNLNQLLLQSFRHSEDLVPFDIHRKLRDLYPDQFVLTTEDYSFNLQGFCEDGKCMIWDLNELVSLNLAVWRGREKGMRLNPYHSFFEVLWNQNRIKCLQVQVSYDSYTFIIAPTLNIAQAFFEAVCRYSGDSDGQIVVFDGCFHREPDLEASVKAANWEDLALPEEFKRSLSENVIGFFDNRSNYLQYGLPWKRGILLHGPPGNGKTHALKALIRTSHRPSLVVRSLRIHDELDEKAIAYIFRKARMMAPCVLVLEDIDSLVDKSNLSSLLNEMDGFAKNEGILCVATTNHLDKLDEAISNRPSRFDKKFFFDNPKKAERFELLNGRFDRMDAAMKPDSLVLARESGRAKGFSGAMLQELVASCMMAWIGENGRLSMNDILVQQVDSLTPKSSKT